MLFVKWKPHIFLCKTNMNIKKRQALKKKQDCKIDIKYMKYEWVNVKTQDNKGRNVKESLLHII